MFDLMLAAAIALALGVAALVVCLLVPAPLGLIIAFFLFLLSLLVDAAAVPSDGVVPTCKTNLNLRDLHTSEVSAPALRKAVCHGQSCPQF